MIQNVVVTFEQLERVIFQVTFYQLLFQWDKFMKNHLLQVLAL